MQTFFSIAETRTVPENYTWDSGAPFESSPNNIIGFSTTNYTSGYAPGVAVVFYNNSISDPEYLLRRFDWDFGDYYNDKTNRQSLTGTDELVSHIFIMPGTYTVNLKHTQTKKAVVIDPGPDAEKCKGLYNIRWYWGALECDKLEATKWSDTECTSLSATRKKRWYDEVACLQKYCKSWNWLSLKSTETSGVNPVTWAQSKTGQEFEKRWVYEANSTLCPIPNADFLNTTSTITQDAPTVTVEVKELMPKAGMYSVTRPVTGVSPFTVQLTPRTCIPGSFPIDRIDWDFGDGSPIRTILRYTQNNADPTLIYNSVYSGDPQDVRNFDVTHTYVRNKQTYSVFYPSLTCYSASTGSRDSCSITIGPVSLPTVQSTEISLLKVRNTLKGNIYTFGANNNVSFATTTTTPFLTSILVPSVPQNRLQDTFGTVSPWFGNPGGTYPGITLEELLATEQNITVFIHTEGDTPIAVD